MSPVSPHFSPSPPPAQSLPALTPMPVPIASPGGTRPHTVIPAPSIQKYSDELRRALSARFKAVAAAGAKARPPPPEARFEDPDYGYDEDPFDTRAKLLLSLNDTPPSQSQSQSQSQTPPVPPRSDPAPPALFEETSYFDLGSDTELSTHSRRWSVASSAPSHALDHQSSWFDGASTPSSEVSYLSEASFEVARASDWISLYGRARLRTPPSNSRRNSLSSLHGASSIPAQMLTPSSLRPLTPLAAKLTPSPQPPVRRFRRRGHPYDLESKPSTPGSPYEPPIIARTTSESMILAAGLASQRERRRGVKAQ